MTTIDMTTTEIPIETLFPFGAGVRVPKTEKVTIDGEQKMIRIVDKALHLIGSGQDLIHTTHRVLDDGEEWDLAVWDGHGIDTKNRNPFTRRYERHNFTLLVLQDMIKSGEMDEILRKDIFGEEDPALTIQHILADKCKEYDRDINDGATMSLVQIRHNHITDEITINTMSVGDSPIMIYCDSQKVYQSTAHDCENKAEIERIARRGSLTFKPSGTFEVLDDEKSLICSVQSQYFEFKGKLLAMGQALGHINYNNPYTAFRKEVAERDGIFGIAPEKATFKFSGRQKLNVKLCSDGVSDVLNEKLLMDQVMKATANASVIAEYAKSRWTQEWNVVKKDEYIAAQGNPHAVLPSQKFTFGKGADDISCISWVQTEDPTM